MDERVEIPGSAPRHAEGLRSSTALSSSEIIDVTIVLRRNPASPDISEQLLAGTFKPAAGQDYTEAAASDVTAVESFATEYGLKALGSDAAARTVKLSGTVAQFDCAFGIRLAFFGAARSYDGPLSVPKSLAGVIVAVLGLDNHAIATHHASNQ